MENVDIIYCSDDEAPQVQTQMQNKQKKGGTQPKLLGIYEGQPT